MKRFRRQLDVQWERGLEAGRWGGAEGACFVDHWAAASLLRGPHGGRPLRPKEQGSALVAIS